MRRRSLPVIQMDHLERFIRAGKPLVVLRTSAAAFQTRKDPHPGYVVWDRFDQEVLGCNYQGYNPKSRETGCDVWIAPRRPNIRSCRESPLSFTAPRGSTGSSRWPTRLKCCCAGRWSTEDPDEPVAWTNTYAGGRVFYTTLGHPGDFENPAFQRLLLNAIHWVSSTNINQERTP